MGLLSASEVAAKWGLTKRRVTYLCSEDRIKGAVKVGSTWVIPDDAERPGDARVKSGRYIKSKADPRRRKGE